MSFDGVHVFAGNADLFRRDFEHGAVIVDHSRDARTVPVRAGVFARLRAAQDPAAGPRVG